jgi:sulfate permease, SulP family
MIAKTKALLPIAHALKESLKAGYSLTTFRQDLLAGLIVSLVALPLAMALAIAVGLPPQHGLYAAIVAGITVPLLGGSIMQVSGPTAAFVVIVAPIVTEHGLHGLIITTIMAGLLLVVLGVAKLGRYINYMPYPVTTGFTSGIAVVIGTLALNSFLGLHIDNFQGEYTHKLRLIAEHLPTLYWPEALVGVVALTIMATSTKILPKIPSPVLGIGIGTLLAAMLQQNGFDIATIGNSFNYTLPDGQAGQGIPPSLPSFHVPGLDASALFALPTFEEIKVLIVPALVIATLAALESLLSAAVADGMAGTRHHPNSELVGVGIGNILSGLAAGIPATGAIARTATNIQSGAKTPLASSFHAVLIMVYVLILAPYMSYIPMASLAALLIMVAYRMSHWRQFLRTIQIAPRSDSLVLITCFGFTVLIDMVAGVTVGVVLACFLLVKRIANFTQTEMTTADHPEQEHLKLPDDTLVYHINGLLFFGTVEKALGRASFIQEHIRTLIIDMENVPFIDMTGLVAMKTLILNAQKPDRTIILCGNREVIQPILRKLRANAITGLKAAESLEKALALVDSKG